jgi:hypothetical protein
LFFGTTTVEEIANDPTIMLSCCHNVLVRFLRTIFGPKRDEVTGKWRKLHSEELNILYSSPNIRQIKSRRIRWAGHVARMGEECVQGFDGKARRKETTWKTKA